jgi:hypothetical protein
MIVLSVGPGTRRVAGSLAIDLIVRPIVLLSIDELDLHGSRGIVTRHVLPPFRSPLLLMIFHNEYGQLARRAFPMLSWEGQEMVAQWGDSGPKGASTSLRDVDLTRWRSEAFSYFIDAVPKSLKDRHPWMQEIARTDALAASMSVRWGSGSPVTAQEINGMSVPDLLTFLAEWKPLNPLDEAPEGLAQQVTLAVADAPGRYAPEATEFAVLHHVYVRGLLRGFSQSIERGRVFEWGPVLSLSAAMVGDSPTGKDANEDQEWDWTTWDILDLLERGLKAGEAEVPIVDRGLVWTILSKASEAPVDEGEPHAGKELMTAVRRDRLLRPAGRVEAERKRMGANGCSETEAQ